MNKEQKETLRKAQGMFSEAITLIETIKEDLEETFEEGSDNWKESEKGQRAEEQIGQLEEVINSLNQADSDIEAAMQ